MSFLVQARHRLKPRTRLRHAVLGRIPLQHTVVVRFSLRVARWSVSAFTDEATRADWFAMRAALFRATAADSLLRQTVRPRRVLVLMDSDDGPLWRRHLDLPAPFVGVFIPAERIDDEIAERVGAERGRHVVVSRLDSDDVFDTTYLQNLDRTVRDAMRAGRDNAYVVACNGFVTDLDRVQRIHYNCSPFISVYARRYQGQGLYDIEHEQILERDPLLNLSARWMQVVHGTNLANRLRTASRFGPGDRREMRLGRPGPVASEWPEDFAVDLPARVRAARTRAVGAPG